MQVNYSNWFSTKEMVGMSFVDVIFHMNVTFEGS